MPPSTPPPHNTGRDASRPTTLQTSSTSDELTPPQENPLVRGEREELELSTQHVRELRERQASEDLAARSVAFTKKQEDLASKDSLESLQKALAKVAERDNANKTPPTK